MPLDVTRFADPGLVAFDPSERDRFRARGWWSGRTLPEEIVQAASVFAERTALVTAEGRWTYRQLVEQAAMCAAGLTDVAGISAGDAVMFQMGNTVETVVAYLGCLLAGARPVCTLPQHGTREVGLLAAHTAAKCLIVQADFRDGRLVGQARQLLQEHAVERVVLARGAGAGNDPGFLPFQRVLAAGAGCELTQLPYRSLDPDQIAVFQLSGGTTGLPKIAPRLHEEYTYNSKAWAAAMHYGPGSTVLYAAPLIHNAGISLGLQPAILSGATLLLGASADADELIALIEGHQPVVLPLVPPAVAIRLLDSPHVRRLRPEWFVDFVAGGQKLPVEVSERLRDELGIAVRQMFGMAEGMFMLTPSGTNEQVRFHTVGCPISPGDEVRILNPGTEQEVADGEIGEFAARGPYTIRGYYRADAHNQSSFTSDGFYRSGDLARQHRTPNGTFYSIEGRLKDVINRGVEKIHAEEVEELIVRHPSVATAALVAMPDPVLGEKGCAFVVLETGAEPVTVESLGVHLLRQGLAKYKLPERVEIVPELPLTNVGKVSKATLRERIAGTLASERRGLS